MNVENLKEIIIVKEFRSYKELCFALGEKPKAGCSKMSQLKEWNRYFRYHKEGYKIIIDEIYESPMEKDDGRCANGKHIYTGDVETVITEYLYEQWSKGRATCNISKTALLSILGVVNDAYKICRNNIKKSSTVMETNPSVTKSMMRQIGKIGGDAIERALKSLYKREDFYIPFTKVITLIVIEEEIIEEEDNELIDKPTFKFVIANQEQVEFIKEVEQDAIKQLNFEFNKKKKFDKQIKIEHKGHIYSYGLRGNFDEKVKPKILQNFGAIGYYDSYRFQLDDLTFISHKSIDVTHNKNKIRDNVLNSINTNINNRIANYSYTNEVSKDKFISDSKKIMLSVMFDGNEYKKLIKGLDKLEKEIQKEKDKIQDVIYEKEKLYEKEAQLEKEFSKRYIDNEEDFKPIKGKTQEEKDYEDSELFG